MLPGPRSRCAGVHARPCQGCQPCLRTIAASGLVLATQEAGNVTGQATGATGQATGATGQATGSGEASGQDGLPCKESATLRPHLSARASSWGQTPVFRPADAARASSMRIVLWHGYLLGGTGSNVYTRALARAWSRAGHEVVVVSQERNPGAYDLGGARVVRPELPDDLLPVFVLDRYEGLEPRLLQSLTPYERERYVEANAAAVRAELPADLVFANHVLLGGPV